MGVLASAGAGCGDDGSSASSGDTPSSTSAGDGSGTAASVTSTDTPTSGSADGSTSGATSPPGTSGATGESDTTGGEIEYCNGWDETATRAFLELYADSQMQTELTDGATWNITCGGQGSWMFPLFPSMGGFVPAGTLVTLSVDVQVEGFAGPTGPFYAGPMYLYDVACFDGGDDDIGGFSHDCIAVLPPDDYLDDLSVLDGAVADVHVDLRDPEGNVVATAELADLVLSAPMRQVGQGCFF